MLKKDVVLFNRWAIANYEYDIGDIVTLARPDKPEKTVIKRIVALEGDVVQTRAPYPEEHIRVPLGLIKSKVEYILYPFDRFGKIPERPRSSRVHYAPGHRVYNQVYE
ncbi:hypothetical protein BGZ94_000184 [Podila epigama]|nr:hypothetical protein BGZ94_000184 [Podila epigama]